MRHPVPYALLEVKMTRTPLEDFVRDYVESAGGDWDEVEPQVYDLLIPRRQASRHFEAEALRITFDPEAVPEHPGSQLASYGTPLIDRLLQDAVEAGRFATVHYLGLNLTPHDLAGRIRRSLKPLADEELRVDRIRALNFAQAFFWFQADFVSDQKEQEILVSSLDLHYGRQVRHREKLLDWSRLSEQPAQALADAARLSLAAAFPLAQREVLRTLATLAHTRDRELRERLSRQAARMQRYYADLRKELDSAPRGKDSAEAQAKRTARMAAIEREEHLRIAELHQKNSLRVELRLFNALLIQQPKLLAQCHLAAPKRPAAPLELVWDPLLDALEAVPCPACQHPTFALGVGRQGELLCDECLGKSVRALQARR
jgi:hypothetical protein